MSVRETSPKRWGELHGNLTLADGRRERHPYKTRSGVARASARPHPDRGNSCNHPSL